MPSCIICHMMIYESIDSYFKCPNGHPIHQDCLKEWLIDSSDCPLCREPYSQKVIENFKDYLKRKEQEIQEGIEKGLQEETIQKMKMIADKMVFLKFIEAIEYLIEEEEYEIALERLNKTYENKSNDYKDLQILFLLGKANYLRGRFDLAINYLFKLVKQKYDFPDAFLYLGKSYQELGLEDKAKWAFDRVT
ncbi:MAG: RING finger domain-containing protein [Promethearchaeota archaeon]